MTRHSATGRADLLRALAQGVESPLALDAGESGWFGYRPRPNRVVPKPAAELHVQPVVPATAKAAPEAPGSDRRQPLQMETIWAVVERTSVSTEATDEAPDEVAVQPITEEEARGLDRIVDYEDLIPWARLTPVLRRHLSQPRRGGIDLKRLCRQVAAQRPLKHLPRQALSRWHPDIVVALDFSPRLWPYRWDMHRLCEQLRRHCGRTGLSLRLFAHGPWGGWTEWLTDGEADGADTLEPQVWKQPPAGARLLVVGDLGALSPDTSLRAQWLDWVQQARTAGVRVEALLPLGADQLPAELAGLLPTIRWSPDSHLRSESGSQHAGAHFADASGEAVDDSLHDLLAQVASLRRVDPPLLRALRRALPHEHGNAGLEGAVWNHPDVEAGLACAVQPAKAQPWLDRYAAQPAAMRQVLQPLRRAHHRHLRAALRDEELLLQAGNGAEELLEPGELSVALDRLDRMSRWAVGQPADHVPAGWQGFAEEAVRRVDARTAERFSTLFTRFLAIEVRARLGFGKGELPAWADAVQILALLNDSESSIWFYWVVEDPVEKRILLQTHAPANGSRGLWGFEGNRVVIRLQGEQRKRLFSLHGQSIELGHTCGFGTIDLSTPTERYLIAPVRRPFGIEGWSFRKTLPGRIGPGWPVLNLPQLRGGETEVHPSLKFVEPPETDVDRRFMLVTPDPQLHSGSEEYGVDTYGVYLDVSIKGTSQRLRYIPPGRFLIGSPTDVLGRNSNEGPQHEVTLTRGFWLADTCCTQALWQAVMGSKNSSEFKGDPNLPVDSVSWDDVQSFLRRLQRYLPPRSFATLPTEAQWEYACRAGTQTLYSFGDGLTPERANVRGSLGRAIPVKSLPANPWGLYEMHGNLWEWCADAPRLYRMVPVDDPDGGQYGDLRVLRGGAWDFVDRDARSSYRDANRRDIRSLYYGFRFTLM